MNNVYAIIVAGGKGARMQASVNKQFLKLKDKPILYYTLKAFSSSRFIDGIILVSAKNEIEYTSKEIIDKYGINKIVKIVSGGKTRQESVYNGLCAAKGSEIVLIHDGARPFVDERIISEGIEYAKKYGACACGVSLRDTIKIKNDSCFSEGTPNRDKLFCVQTPQCFKYNLITECHRKVMDEGISVTDDTTVVERYNNQVYLYEGSYNNIKITFPEDLILAEAILDSIK